MYKIHPLYLITFFSMVGIAFFMFNVAYAQEINQEPGINFYSENAKALFYGTTDRLVIDSRTGIEHYEFTNDSVKIRLRSDVPQYVRFSVPFGNGSKIVYVENKITEHEIQVSSYRGLYLVGIFTTKGEVYLRERVDSFGVQDFSMVVAYSDMRNQMWKYSFYALGVLLVGFVTTRAMLSIAFFKLKSSITILQIAGFFVVFSILFGWSVGSDIDIDRVEVSEGIYELIENPVKVYDFNLGDGWKLYTKFLFVVPYILGMAVARSVTPFNAVDIMVFKVGGIKYERLKQSITGLCTDKLGRVLFYQFIDDSFETVEVNGVGEVILASQLEKEKIEIDDETDATKTLIVGAFGIVFAVVGKEFLGFSFHWVYYLSGFTFYYVVDNWERVVSKLGFYPQYIYHIECSPLMTSDSVTKSIMSGQLDAIINEYREVIRTLIIEQIKGPFEVSKELFKINDRLRTDSQGSGGPVQRDINNDQGAYDGFDKESEGDLSDEDAALEELMEMAMEDEMGIDEIEAEATKRLGLED